MRIVQAGSSVVLAAAGVMFLGGAIAQTSVDRSFDPAPKDCADVRWSPRVLEAFPSIARACQSVEERNGITYVKLEGTVERVKKGGKQVRVDLEDGKEMTFRPTPHTSLYIDGKRSDFADLEDGAKLNFYIPEDRLEAQVQPDPQRVAFVIFPIVLPDEPAVQQQARAELPSTGGLLPAIGVAGAMLLLLSVIVRVIRSRSSGT